MALQERPAVDKLIHHALEVAASVLRSFADFLSPPTPSDPVERILDDSPADDEPVTSEEAAAIENARREHERGETVSLAEIKRTSGG
jgi:hypothetical protein